MDEIFVQVRFKVNTPQGEYNDALNYTLTEYQNIVQEDIDAAKALRVTNWINSVQNPPAENEASKEYLEALKESLELQLKEIEEKIKKKDDVVDGDIIP